MTIEIKVPVLPESVPDALLLDWHKNIGDTVMRDEILVEVETDKVVLEVPAPVDGSLVEILLEAGSTVTADQVLAKLAPTPDAQVGTTVHPSEPDTATPSTETPDEQRLSPAVRRLLSETGIEAENIDGSGRDGRITKEDVLVKISDSASADAPAAKSAAKNTSLPDTEQSKAVPEAKQLPGSREEIREPMSRLRQTIANRLVQSQQSAALLTTFNEVDMNAVMSLRSRYKENFEKTHGARLGFMSFFVKASVVALKRFPLVNAYIDGTDIIRHLYQDIGIAVASPRGLVVPVLRNCEAMSYADIEQKIQELGMRARDGKITMDELIGGTFTITNGGVFGSLLSTPIVNPPQSAILGMHKIQQRPMAENGEVVVRPMMYLALSYDHRIVDGKEAVQFLITIKETLEDPARLLLDC